MKKFLFFFLVLLNTTLFGCAACTLMVPKAEISIDLNFQKKDLTNTHIEWLFSDLYTEELLTQYDKNRNKIYDKEELRAIKKDMLDYLVPKNILTTISYAKETDEAARLDIKSKFKNHELKVVDGRLLFSYNLDLGVKIDDKSTLSFSFEDDEGFFGFLVTDLDINASEIYHNKNLYLFTAFVTFSHTSFEDKEEVKAIVKQEDKILAKPVEKISSTKLEEQVDIKKEPLQENLLKESITKIKFLFESIEDEKNPLTYLLLLVFAYIYGLIHALGPGHGKTLVASYFLSNKKSYSKALFVSLAIGVVHTFSAFLLTVIIYFGINTFLTKFLNDTVFYTTKISALIIIFIALYLFYKKYRAYKKINELKKSPEYSFSTAPHISTCSCAACEVEKDSTDVALIISAGIIPCPGTITIFIFSLSLGLYYAGFLSALVMSLGMSTIIFFSAVLSVALRKKALDSNTNLKKYLEYGSLVIILLLGVLLLFT